MPAPAVAGAVRSRLAARVAGIAAGVLAGLARLPLIAIVGMLGAAPQLSAGGAADVACSLSPDGRDGIPSTLLATYDRAASAYGPGRPRRGRAGRDQQDRDRLGP